MNYSSDPYKAQHLQRSISRLSRKSVKFIKEEMEGIRKGMIGTTGMASPWMISEAVKAHKIALDRKLNKKK